jgi:hypothetical protein
MLAAVAETEQGSRYEGAGGLDAAIAEIDELAGRPRRCEPPSGVDSTSSAPTESGQGAVPLLRGAHRHRQKHEHADADPTRTPTPGVIETLRRNGAPAKNRVFPASPGTPTRG